MPENNTEQPYSGLFDRMFDNFTSDNALYASNSLKMLKDMLANPEKCRPRNESERMKQLREKARRFNQEPGLLTGYECDICKNKGVVNEIKDGFEFLHSCSCIRIRENLSRIENCGLKELLDEYTFEKYFASNEWQKHIKTKALEFTNSDVYGKWFYIGGQVGCGKTHICTAMAKQFLDNGITVKYMLWRDEVVNLKAKVNNDEEYSRAIIPYKTVKMLYIDDFFKTMHGETPTQGDVNLAFEILNYRYNNKSLITILSGERTMESLLDIDEAVGSRIYQRTKDYCINISRDVNKNYRLQ